MLPVSPMKIEPGEVVKQETHDRPAQRRAEQDHQRMAALQGIRNVVVTATRAHPAARSVQAVDQVFIAVITPTSTAA